MLLRAAIASGMNFRLAPREHILWRHIVIALLADGTMHRTLL
jgi:hypothetical protein